MFGKYVMIQLLMLPMLSHGKRVTIDSLDDAALEAFETKLADVENKAKVDAETIKDDMAKALDVATQAETQLADVENTAQVDVDTMKGDTSKAYDIATQAETQLVDVSTDSDVHRNTSAAPDARKRGARDADMTAWQALTRDECLHDAVRGLYMSIRKLFEDGGAQFEVWSGDQSLKDVLQRMFSEDKQRAMVRNVESTIRLQDKIFAIDVSLAAAKKQRASKEYLKSLEGELAQLKESLKANEKEVRAGGFSMEVAKELCESDKYLDESIVACVDEKVHIDKPATIPNWARQVWQLRLLQSHATNLGAKFGRSNFTIAVRDKNRTLMKKSTHHDAYDKFFKKVGEVLEDQEWNGETPFWEEEKRNNQGKSTIKGTAAWMKHKIAAHLPGHKTEFDERADACRNEQFEQLHKAMEKLRHEITGPPSMWSMTGCTERSDEIALAPGQYIQRECPEGLRSMTKVSGIKWAEATLAFGITEAVMHPIVAFFNLVVLPVSGGIIGGVAGAAGGPLGILAGVATGAGKGLALGGLLETFAPISLCASCLSGLWFSLPDVECACFPRECKYDEQNDVCSLDAAAHSNNPYSAVLPFPGWKCQHNTFQGKHVCAQMACADEDFEAVRENGSYSGKLGVMDKSLYNCLKINDRPHAWLGKFVFASSTLADGFENNIFNRKKMYSSLSWNAPNKPGA